MTSAEENTQPTGWLQELARHYPGTRFLGKCLTVAQILNIQLAADDELDPEENFVVSGDTRTVWIPTGYTPTQQRSVLRDIVVTLVLGAEYVEGLIPTRRPWLAAAYGKLLNR